MKRLTIVVATLVPSALVSLGQAKDWKPAAGPLMTRWAKEVSPDNVHPEYPRPQMVRPDWLNLNGLWDYAIAGKEAGRPEAFDGTSMMRGLIEVSMAPRRSRLVRAISQACCQSRSILAFFARMTASTTVEMSPPER